MDAPVIMAARRDGDRVAPAMGEMFAAHPAGHGRLAWFTRSLNYYLAVLFFNAFRCQREAGARQTLRLYRRRLAGHVGADLPGRPAVEPAQSSIPARNRDDRLAPQGASRPGRIDRLACARRRIARQAWPRQVAFGGPLRLTGDDYSALAERVEEAVRAL